MNSTVKTSGRFSKSRGLRASVPFFPLPHPLPSTFFFVRPECEISFASNGNACYAGYSGSGGPTERISNFVDSLLQPIAKKQESYIKNTTHFINFIENTRLPDNAILVSLDVCSLYTNIPQEEGINVVCKTTYPNNISEL